ncbi:MAG TPA: class I SAM-dependent methyltransferase [Streptosporangiaceae bacterium]|nr:class I SAM-dependent methyltransferase [Streptosporangiaceae bacterium]
MPNDREQLRVTFDSIADNYHQARPEYPSVLYAELIELAELRAGDQLLEIGCATGKATIPLADRGFSITCVELGSELAAAARRNLAGYPGVEVVQGAFEDWGPAADGGYSLVFAATSWHWIDPAVRYQKAWDMLRPGGHLALWATDHVFPVGGDSFFQELQPVYEEIGEARLDDCFYPRPDQMRDFAAEITGSGLFTDVQVRRFDWEIKYTADRYIALLDTFSNHIAMDQAKRDRLYGEIRRRLAERPGGQLRRHWGAVLHVARRAS